MQVQLSIRIGNLGVDSEVITGMLRNAGMDLDWNGKTRPGDTLTSRDTNERGIPVRLFTWHRPDELVRRNVQIEFHRPQTRQLRLED